MSQEVKLKRKEVHGAQFPNRMKVSTVQCFTLFRQYISQNNNGQ